VPTIGETRKASELGYSVKDHNLYRWIGCENCGCGKWGRISKGKPVNPLCHHCGSLLSLPRREANPGWKGGRYRTKDGYIRVLLAHDDFFLPMASKDRRVPEHRLIMARYLGRCLLRWEIVHHKNGIRDDNRLVNLVLLPSRKYHVIDTVTKHRLAQLEARMVMVEAENAALRKQVIDLTESLKVVR